MVKVLYNVCSLKGLFSKDSDASQQQDEGLWEYFRSERSSSLQLQGQKKTLLIFLERQGNIEVQILRALGNIDTARNSCFIKILFVKLSDILQLKSEVKSLSQGILSKIKKSLLESKKPRVGRDFKNHQYNHPLRLELLGNSLSYSIQTPVMENSFLPKAVNFFNRSLYYW